MEHGHRTTMQTFQIHLLIVNYRVFVKNVSSSMIEIVCYEADIAIKMVPIDRARLAQHFDVRFFTFLLLTSQ